MGLLTPNVLNVSDRFSSSFNPNYEKDPSKAFSCSQKEFNTEGNAVRSVSKRGLF